MLKNYLVTSICALSRQRLYSLINIGRLSIGLAASLLIYVYVNAELMYDRHIKDAERIYRAGINKTFKGDEVLYSETGSPLALAMSDEIPEVESAVRLFSRDNSVRVWEKSFM
ncbi:MAG: hypothetical protein ABIR06_15630 [Cyclobacteriaceae bacterium]